MTATPLAAAAIAQLEAEGVDTVIGTVVNPAGLTQAKTVPIRRTNTFANPGLGASPVWHTFCIDQCSIAFTADISVVGDQRLRIDLSALRIIGDGLAWAPAGFFEQDGTPVPACSRGTLSRIEAALADAGIDAVIGHEVEFLLVDADGQRLPRRCGRSTVSPGCSSTRRSSAMSTPRQRQQASLSSSSIPNTVPTNSRSR